MTSDKMANSRKILIVEDEPLIAWSLADMIRTLGYEVCGTVATESAAVVEATGCDAVVMDFRLAAGGSAQDSRERRYADRVLHGLRRGSGHGQSDARGAPCCADPEASLALQT
jgi:CheY-like chemotaxis protein